jgi:hypothetical protein
MSLLQGTSGSGDAAWVTTLTDDLILAGGVSFSGTGTIGAGGATLTSADSGKLYAVAQQAGNTAITLPATATSTGVWYTFLLTTAAAGNVAITADGATLLGVLVEGGAAATAVLHTSVAFDGGTGVVGDNVTVRCDGARWLVSGIGSNANSWVLA